MHRLLFGLPLLPALRGDLVRRYRESREPDHGSTGILSRLRLPHRRGCGLLSAHALISQPYCKEVCRIENILWHVGIEH
jgi:hypothetical protein